MFKTIDKDIEKIKLYKDFYNNNIANFDKFTNNDLKNILNKLKKQKLWGPYYDIKLYFVEFDNDFQMNAFHFNVNKEYNSNIYNKFKNNNNIIFIFDNNKKLKIIEPSKTKTKLREIFYKYNILE